MTTTSRKTPEPESRFRPLFEANPVPPRLFAWPLRATMWVAEAGDRALYQFPAVEDGWEQRKPYTGSLSALDPIPAYGAAGTGWPYWHTGERIRWRVIVQCARWAGARQSELPAWLPRAEWPSYLRELNELHDFASAADARELVRTSGFSLEGFDDPERVLQMVRRILETPHAPE